MNVSIYLAAILLLGIGAQWIAWRLRLPAILLLLLLGFLTGFWISPREILGDELLFPLVSIAVAVIMFEGGLSLKLRDVRETGGVVLRLVTVGVLITWIGSALAIWSILDFSPAMAVLAGAILVVSGPTVIVPLLQHIRPVGRIGALVKWEGIVNDPIGAVLAVLVFELIALGGFSDKAAGEIALSMFATLGVGAIIGAAGAISLLWALKRYWIPDYLHVSVTLALVVTAFTLSNHAWSESGLVAVTMMGVVVANQRGVGVQHVVEFKENLRVLLISLLFIVLASRVKWEQIQEVGWRGLAVLAILILVIRPLMVLVSTWGSDLSRNERILLAWLHPRGIVAAAVSSLFALELVHRAGADVSEEIKTQANLLAPLVFVVIVGTVTVYGLTSGLLARRLGLARRDPQGILYAGAEPWVRQIATAVQEEGFAVMLVDTNYPNIAAARMAGLPTCYASILSEYVHEEQELADLGRLLAMTPNAEVNSLAVMAFIDHFGRAEVYQLAAASVESGSARRTPSTHQQHGRYLFGTGITHEFLMQRFAAGAQVKRTGLTEDFDYDDFLERYGPGHVLLFVVESATRLTVCTTDFSAKPQPGQRLIALVDPVAGHPVADAAEATV